MVVPPELRAAVAPLIEQRAAEGWEVTVLSPPADDPAPLAEEIARRASRAEAACLLLVGDAGAAAGTPRVPPGQGSQLRMKGRPSDRPWALLAGVPGRPVPTGRLPARTPEEAATMVRKILAWPDQAHAHDVFPQARLIVGYHAAPEPFAPMADELINGVTQRLVARMPSSWRVSGFVHINDSPWQGIYEELPAAVQAMMASPASLLAYMGHSDLGGGNSKSFRFLSGDDWRRLPGDAPHAGLFFSCGCHSCDLAGSEESFGFAAMRAPGGPAAVIGSQGVSYAAMGTLAMSGLITALSTDPPPVRLGTLWQGVQAGLAEGEIDATEFAMMDMADGSKGGVPLAAQRLEHLESWMLLGDPAMPLFPGAPTIRLKCENAVTPGADLIVTGQLPEEFAGATVRVTFERHPGTRRNDLPKVAPTGKTRLASASERRKLSEDVVLAGTDALAAGATFRATLRLPATLPTGPWTLRAVIAGQSRGAAGAMRVP